MMPEPFVVQAIASTLAHCPFATTGCYAVDIGGNLGIHTAYMASLGAELDVVEAAADLAPVIERTMRLNCWADRVRVHKNAITANASNDGVPFYFRGGWRLDDRGAKNRRQHPITQIAIQRFLKNRRVDLIKIDIDNGLMETSLIVAIERMLAAKATTIGAMVIETTRLAGVQAALATALSRLQKAHGYHIYRLAHHLHQMQDPQPWYSPCIGARLIKYMLHIMPLSPAGWMQLLYFKRDQGRGRADGSSFLIAKDAIGQGAEARWNSESMDGTMPAAWRDARCGAAANTKGKEIMAEVLGGRSIPRKAVVAVDKAKAASKAGTAALRQQQAKAKAAAAKPQQNGVGFLAWLG